MNKNKEVLRREILSLIADIKEHADGLNPDRHFPQLELEAISSKIRKLYERSVILSFINSISEEELLTQEENAIDIKGIGDMEVPVLDYPISQYKGAALVETPVTIKENPSPAEGTTRPTEVAPAPAPEPVPVAAVNTESVSASQFPDITKTFGINLKLQFLNQLFKGRNQEYTVFFSELNACSTAASSRKYVEECCNAFGWNTESDLIKQLFRFIDKRFAS